MLVVRQLPDVLACMRPRPRQLSSWLNLQENHGEPPDFQVGPRCNPFLDVERFDLGIIAVFVDAADDEVALAFAQEPFRCASSPVRKVHQSEIATDADETGNDAFDDENPTPATVAC